MNVDYYYSIESQVFLNLYHFSYSVVSIKSGFYTLNMDLVNFSLISLPMLTFNIHIATLVPEQLNMSIISLCWQIQLQIPNSVQPTQKWKKKTFKLNKKKKNTNKRRSDQCGHYYSHHSLNSPIPLFIKISDKFM